MTTPVSPPTPSDGTTPVTDPAPAVAIIVPCHDEEAFVGELLGRLIDQLPSRPGWRAILVDDRSVDATGAILDRAAARHPELLVVHHGHYGSPGGARSAAVAIAEHTAERAGAPRPQWVLTTDVDVVLPDSWLADWAAALAAVHDDETVGAVNGEEAQEHLLEPFPRARQLSGRFGEVVVRSEALVGVTNLNGVNHAVRRSAYETCGPYLQPTAPGPDGPVVLAGEDWDLGVRLRRAGYRIATADVVVADRGRRLLADLRAYLGGTAYEGAFTRVGATAAATDLTEAELDALWSGTARRALLHFYFKPLLAVPSLLEGEVGLSPATVDAMRAWMARWPAPTFAESRNGFLYGRLPRFVDAFVGPVLDELGLSR